MHLPTPPDRKFMHLVADWVELACCLSESGQITGGALVDAREDADALAGREPTVERLDEHQIEAELVWGYLRLRAERFGEQYPFVVADDVTSVATQPLTDARTLYCFLLCASSLRATTKAELASLTASFERVSKHALRGLVPRSWSVEVFGTTARPGERYSQAKLRDRLAELACVIGGELMSESLVVDDANHGDGGLDLVAHPTGLVPPTHVPLYFGQCACGVDWKNKQHEVLPTSWSERIRTRSWIVPVVFIPFSYRDESAAWADPWGLKAIVLVDRDRFLDLVQSDTSSLADALGDAPVDWLQATLIGFGPATALI